MAKYTADNRNGKIKKVKKYNLFYYAVVITKKYYKLLVAGPAVAALAALLYVFSIAQPLWEATVLVQVGQVGSTPIESAGLVFARMTHPSFVRSALMYTSKKEDEETLAIYENTLKVAQVKGTELLEFRLMASSSQLANELVLATVRQLQEEHNEIMDAMRTRLNSQISLTTKNIQELRTEESELKKKLFGDSNWGSYNATLTASVLQDKANKLRELIEKEVLQKEQLTPARTFPTKVFGGIYVSKKPIWPRKRLTVLLALLGGLLASILWAFAHHSYIEQTTSEAT